MRRMFLISSLMLLAVMSCSERQREDRVVERLLSQLTLEEKIGMVHANTMFSSGGVERLGIPSLKYTDGPHGVRWESVDNGWKSLEWGNDACTYLPALSALTATWNRDLARQYGEVLGEECKARGKHVNLAPGVNINRTVLNGRTWEYMSEDPYISAEMAVPYIQGVQSKGVASCVKHFALNSQAWHQYTISSEVDDRTMHEIYMPAFEASICRAGAMAVMPAYNKVRGKWCSESRWLLDTLLRGELGFDGLVVSDWNGVHNTVETALAGTDVEMGTAIKENGLYAFDKYYFANPLLEKIKDGTVPESVLDEKVRNILRLMHRLDLIGAEPYDTTGMASRLATPAHVEVARKVAEESVVLLKNDCFLPLNPNQYNRIAVIGANADQVFAHGGGSTKLKAKYEVTPLQGLKNLLGPDVVIDYAPGYKLRNKQYVAAYHKFTDEFDMLWPEMVEEAVQKAAAADLVIYVGGLTHEHGMDCEGYDRPDMKLPYRQDELISAVMEANPNTVVVLMAGSPVELGEWHESARALVNCSFIGMEGGNVLADVLFGNVNPSGKLTTTWSMKLSDMPDHAIGEYPGADEKVHFNEGIMVGYRYFDTYGVVPMYEFGYGLSYTDFKYSDLEMEPVWKDGSRYKLSFKVTNVGEVKGKESAQVYVRQNESSAVRPYKELKGFDKVELLPGETKQVTVYLDRRSLSWYDAQKKAWVAEDGMYSVFVGASSRDVRLNGGFEYINH